MTTGSSEGGSDRAAGDDRWATMSERRPRRANSLGGRRTASDGQPLRSVFPPFSLSIGRRLRSRDRGYGSTEAGGVSRMICYEECYHVRSAGRLTENVEVKIVDNLTGKSLSFGQTGELWVRGPAVMIGYVGDNEANASTFTSDGWLKTGDICYIDHNGFLCVVDRLKELIKYKGYQVPPAELEHLLQSLPGVADVAVIPYPDEEFGQIPMAFIVRQPEKSLTETEVIDFVAKQVAPYKKIRKVAFVNSIPKSPSGKILRRELRDQILGKTNSRL